MDISLEKDGWIVTAVDAHVLVSNFIKNVAGFDILWENRRKKCQIHVKNHTIQYGCLLYTSDAADE